MKNFNLKRVFYIYLIIHVLLWSGIALLRPLLPIDASESVLWGSLLDFGTNKHPPLAGWISYFVYIISGKWDFSVYLIGQLFIAAGLFYIYKIGRLFLDETKAILSSMIMEACYVYSYCTIYDGFNPNFILFCLLPMIVYYFYLAVNGNKKRDWLLLGFLSGLALLAKYQSVMLFLPMLMYLIFTKKGRVHFKNIYLYIAGIIAFLIFLPHLIWLFEHNFFPFGYFALSEEKYSGFFKTDFKYILSPLLFIFRQFVTLAGVIFIYFSAKFFFKSPMKLNKNMDDNAVFLLFMGVFPILLQALPGLINGAFLIPVWGFTLIFLSGVMLFYFFPMDITDKIIKYMIAWIVLSMVTISTVLAIVFTTFKDFSNLFPVKDITNKMQSIYYQNTGETLKYVSGFIEYSIPLGLYNEDIDVVLDCWGNENPWLDKDTVLQSGLLLLDKKSIDIEKIAQSLLIDTDEVNIVANSYIDIQIYSLVGRKKDYKLYYAILQKK